MKALEALERLKENKENLKQYSCSECKYTDFEYNGINTNLSNNKDISIIENALKALDIIKAYNLLLNNKHFDKLNEEEKNILIENGVLK